VGDFPKILGALSAAVSLDDAGRRSEVVRKLEEITATRPEEVVKAAREMFDQRNWAVHGNVIQGQNVSVTIGTGPSEPVKGLLDKWQTWAGLVATLLTVFSLAAGLPGKLGFPILSSDETVLEQPLGGSVRDEETNEFLEKVDVTLPDLGHTVTTNPDGHFLFRVQNAAKQDLVTVVAKKKGYVSSEPKKQILGNTKVTILLRKER
jgi:hypothetical protein